MIFIFLGVALLIFLVVAAIYVGSAIFLNEFNKLVDGKGSSLSWIPFANLYLLGKLTVNKAIGWILIGGEILIFILSARMTITINGMVREYSLIPAGVHSFLTTSFEIAIVIVLILGIIKFYNLKKESRTKNNETLKY